MAHQTDVHVVHQEFKSEDGREKVVDPVCGMKMEKKDSKNMVFRGDQTIYFCSKACEDRFLEPRWKKVA